MVLSRALNTRLARAVSASLVAIALMIPTLMPSPASAIIRNDVLNRARSWTDRRIPYSQSRYFEGYRTDCSGFVSMAWAADKSYTTRTIGAIANPVALSELIPGDAILTPGHIVIFGGWTNSSHTQFLSLEEANSRLDSIERIKNLPRNARGLRYKGITQPAPIPEPPAPKPTEPAKSPDQMSAEQAALTLQKASLMVAAVAEAEQSAPMGFTVEPAV